MDNYVVVSLNECDPPSVMEMSREVLKEKLKENYWGRDVKFAEPGKVIDTTSFVGLIIVKGHVVKPQATTTYDL